MAHGRLYLAFEKGRSNRITVIPVADRSTLAELRTIAYNNGNQGLNNHFLVRAYDHKQAKKLAENRLREFSYTFRGL